MNGFSVPLTLKLAFRNIFRNRRRTLLTGLSMLAGYVLLVVSFSLQDGVYHYMLEAYTQDSSGHLQITHKDYLDNPTLYRTVNNSAQLETLLEGDDLIKGLTSRIHSTALAYGDNKTGLAMLIGIDVARERTVSFIENKIQQGKYLTQNKNADGYYQAMIGQGLASSLKLQVGDELVLISQAIDGSMANDIFIVSAIVGKQGSAERFNVYLPLVAMQQFMAMPNAVHRLILLIDDYEHSEEAALQLQQKYQSTLAEHDLAVFPWQVVEKEFYRVMKADKEGNVISMYIVVFLVCLGVLNTILMSILERTGEFGVLKAIGTSPTRIFIGILLESQVLAILCCVLGFLIALPINYYFTYVGIQLPEPMEISGLSFEYVRGLMNITVFMYPASILLCATFLISIIPAYRAAKIKPLDAMRSL